MIIELVGVRKRYGKLVALDVESLRIDPGQIVAILGANGAGKTTLLRCLASVVAPDEGHVLMCGRRLTRDDLDIRRALHFIPDFPHLFFENTVARNLAILLRLYQAETPDSLDRITGLLREFDLLPLAGTPVGSLSRGQIYKVALVGLIAVNPRVWLLDEPFASGMDPHGLTAFKRHAREATEKGQTVIFTTQILESAEKLADRACVLHQGTVRSYSTLQDIRAHSTDPANPLESIFRSLRETAP